MNPKPIPLTLLAGEIAKLTGGAAPSYRRLYLRVLDGKLPGAEQDEIGRWHVRRSDLPAVVAAFGLEPAKRNAA